MQKSQSLQEKTERVDYSYDFRGQVSTTTTYATVNADGSGNTTSGTHAVTTFVYDPHGRLLQTIDARGTPSADPNDYLTAYTYDGLGRLLATSQWVDATHTRTTVTQYDDAGNRVVTTAANGLVTTSTFDRAGHLIAATQGSASQTLGTTTYQYDAAGRFGSPPTPPARRPMPFTTPPAARSRPLMPPEL